jgi:hypothetical protein
MRAADWSRSKAIQTQWRIMKTDVAFRMFTKIRRYLKCKEKGGKEN